MAEPKTPWLYPYREDPQQTRLGQPVFRPFVPVSLAVEGASTPELGPRRKDEPGAGPHLAPLRQRIESIYWTAKDILTLERHGARTLHGLPAMLQPFESPQST